MRNERGMTLVEVLVALVILTVSMTAMLHAVSTAMWQQATTRDREELLARAGRVMSAYALMSRAELDQRIGQQPVRGFRVRVQRPRSQLYRLSLTDSLYPDQELLVTLVFRAGTP